MNYIILLGIDKFTIYITHVSYIFIYLKINVRARNFVISLYIEHHLENSKVRANSLCKKSITNKS